MKRMIGCLMAISLVFLFSKSTLAQDKLVQSVKDGCKTEIATYCKAVTPGKERVLACLYAYGDKLSNRCEYALYDASIQLERFTNSMKYVANECRDDLKAYCSAVKPGEGRLLECIDKNKTKISERCTQAIKDVGIKGIKK